MKLLYFIIVKTGLALSITSWNVLAPIHRSMAGNLRESERDFWWKPRAEFVADHVATEFCASDVILLQEWWCLDEFEDIFQARLGDTHSIITERRPDRQDGMAVLIKKEGHLEFDRSEAIPTAPQRIAQLVHCRERVSRAHVQVCNAHLSFPGHENDSVNEQRQCMEVQRILKAMGKENDALQIIAGDFNSNSQGLAARTVESRHGFVNCASARAEQALSHTGGQVNLGITHRTHRGEDVSVDHVFARKGTRVCESLLRLGYLDTVGTRVVDCSRGNLALTGDELISDHRPVTATIEWPLTRQSVLSTSSAHFAHVCSDPLDPLEPPSYMGANFTGVLQTSR